MMKIMKQNFHVLALAAVALLAAACATTKPAQKSTTDQAAAAGQGAQNQAPAITPPPTDVTEASLRVSSSTGEFALRDDLKPVPFDYDSAKLSEDALAILKANAEILKSDPDLEIRIAGHCDERGTVPYNLALGQKRANQVRDYYIQLGIEKSRLATISYGKEQPLCADSNEECWARNRRAESAARAKAGTPAAAPAVPAAAPTAQ
jgi:peptidoglycan-associated lipoprotein